MIFFIALGALFATVVGGLFTLKFRDQLHLILGFSAGAILGVVFFDLIPEAVELTEGTYEVHTITALTAMGFLVYLILDRFFLYRGHCHNDDNEHHHDHAGHTHGSGRGVVGAASISLHSFLDGMAIGLAFKVSAVLGIVVAVAVLIHGFSDGVNTVNLILKNQGNRKTAITWLSIDALAPIAGIITSYFLDISDSVLGLMLALFAGFFIYIGASELLPESHHSHSTKLTTVMTIVGMAILYIAITIAHS